MLHVNPQDVPSHVEVACAGATQAVHDPPHEAVLVLSAHAPEQAW